MAYFPESEMIIDDETFSTKNNKSSLETTCASFFKSSKFKLTGEVWPSWEWLVVFLKK
jgi:hypothetical protein